MLLVAMLVATDEGRGAGATEIATKPSPEFILIE